MTIKWTRSYMGKPVSLPINSSGGNLTSPNLTIDKVRWLDGGIYTCNVSLGTDLRIFDVILTINTGESLLFLFSSFKPNTYLN